jgi:hypothetical protein
MNGKRYILDTNAISAVLAENKSLLRRLKDAEWIGISIISFIEISVFTGLDEESKLRLNAFIDRVEVLGLSLDSSAHVARTIQIRQAHKLKLPDAVIAACAIEQNATLVTADSEFKRVSKLDVFDFQVNKSR